MLLEAMIERRNFINSSREHIGDVTLALRQMIVVHLLPVPTYDLPNEISKSDRINSNHVLHVVESN